MAIEPMRQSISFRTVSLSAADAIQGGRLVVVGRGGRQKGRPREQPAKAPKVAFIPGAGEHLHADWIADRDLAPDQLLDAIADAGPRVAFVASR